MTESNRATDSATVLVVAILTGADGPAEWRSRRARVSCGSSDTALCALATGTSVTTPSTTDRATRAGHPSSGASAMTAGSTTLPSRASTAAAARGAGAPATITGQAHVVARLEARDRGTENSNIVAALLHPARLDRVQGRWIAHVGHAVHETGREGGADQLLTLAAGVDIAALRGWKGVAVLNREIAAAHASRAPGPTVTTTRGAPVASSSARGPSPTIIRAQDRAATGAESKCQAE